MNVARVAWAFVLQLKSYCTMAAEQNHNVMPLMVCGGEKVPFTTATRDQSNHLCHKGGSENVIQAQSSRGDVTPVEVKDNKDGMWAVTDVSNHCVWIFDREDQLVRKFGSRGNDNGQFINPSWVAFDDNNHLYVIDSHNNRVQKFNITGT